MDGFQRKSVNQRPSQPVTEPSERPVSPQAPSSADVSPTTAPQPLSSPEEPPKTGRSKKKIALWGVLGVFGAVLIACAVVVGIFLLQLKPVDAGQTDKQEVVIVSGSSPSQIAEMLEAEGLIQSQTVFLWYARLNGVENSLQAGAYRLSPSESTPEIIDHLMNGSVDMFSVTFIPGATLDDNRAVLIGAGYSETEVDEALAKNYDAPLFAGKPASADLEGYIYPETYTFGTEASVEDILQYTFDYYYGVIEENNLVSGYEAQGLNLFEGITLASIIQREAKPDGSDMEQIAQVFYSRLAIDMPLGADATYQYIADKTGVARDTALDSPYNTRIYQGLTPGPIAAPGEMALKATANPAEGNYLYFVSGDDGVTYFSRTLEEHEANTREHCVEKCQIL